MTTCSADPLLLAEERDDALRLTFNRPARGNSLVPDLLDACLAALAKHKDAPTLILTGAGKAFSTGGDIRGFLDNAGTADRLQTYASHLVGQLNTLILELNRHPSLIIAHVNGPVTGGSLGLMLAADHVVMAPSAFIQPYYTRMGFAPDGGWTAMLPQRIGAHRAQNWLARDERWRSEQVVEAGLAQDRAAAADAEVIIQRVAERNAGLDPNVIATSRQLIAGHGLAARLEAERQAFLRQIGKPETLERMEGFLHATRQSTSGAA